MPSCRTSKVGPWEVRRSWASGEEGWAFHERDWHEQRHRVGAQQRNQPRCTWISHMKEFQETRWIKRWGYPALRSDPHSEAVQHPTRVRAFSKTDLIVIGGMGWEVDKHVKEAIAEVQPEEDALKSGRTSALFITQSSVDPQARHGVGVQWIVSRWVWMLQSNKKWRILMTWISILVSLTEPSSALQRIDNEEQSLELAWTRLNRHGAQRWRIPSTL